MNMYNITNIGRVRITFLCNIIITRYLHILYNGSILVLNLFRVVRKVLLYVKF